jgi:Zn-finger nucleic acid-binding protein
MYTQLIHVQTEVSIRNQHISERDQYIYSDKLERSIDIPVGHDFTPVNWLKRAVEIHKIMFMGRPFSMIANYDTQDTTMAADDDDKQRREMENKKEKAYAEQRSKLIDSIVRDNGGHALFMDGAENCSAIGSWIVKTWYDNDEKKFHISPIEAVENCFVIWNRDNFRQHDFFAYAFQVSREEAASNYGLSEDQLKTSPLGSPFLFSAASYPGQQFGSNNSTYGATSVTSGQTTGQPMVTIIEGTGKLEGWKSVNGKLRPCPIGQENEINVVFVGGKLVRILDDEKKLPKYYIFPNNRTRRRAWGVSDITDGAINLNVTYIETLSDWRTVANKVNFPKLKGFNFGQGATLPKFKNRQIQLLPLGDGMDIAPLPLGDGGSIDWSRQLDEIKNQFVRETGLSRVLFDDPTVALNSNQALLTSMKPTSDIAEAKKQLWSPILAQLFTDAIYTVAAHEDAYKDLADGNWWLKVQWPSVMSKEDPTFQAMLLNRLNAGTMSIESYLQMQGETKEEIDRIRDEMADPITAGIHGKQLAELAHFEIYRSLGIPPWGFTVPKLNFRADLAPEEVGNIAHNYGWDQGPYGDAIGPQGNSGLRAADDWLNHGMIAGAQDNSGTPSFKKAPNAQITTPGQNQPGQQPMSQPGTGATTTSPQGAQNQQVQNNGG